ncbi:MAG: hypothetical protein WAN20_25395 [Pseudonocardiaceae bacterium]
MRPPPSPELRAKVARTRASQGLPPVITDPATLERVAAVLRLAAPDEPLVPSQRKRRRTPTVDNQEVAPSPRQ